MPTEHNWADKSEIKLPYLFTAGNRHLWKSQPGRPNETVISTFATAPQKRRLLRVPPLLLAIFLPGSRARPAPRSRSPSNFYKGQSGAFHGSRPPQGSAAQTNPPSPTERSRAAARAPTRFEKILGWGGKTGPARGGGGEDFLRSFKTTSLVRLTERPTCCSARRRPPHEASFTPNAPT